MEPDDDAPKDGSQINGSPRPQRSVSRITLLEVLIAVAIIAALIAWLPNEWNK